MKQLIIILFSFVCTISVYSQSNVFVLVDVSKSVSPNQLTDAKQALNEVLTGSQLTKAVVSQGNLQDLAEFKLLPGDKLDISKFGDLQTTLGISPHPTQIQNVISDVNQVLNSLPWIPTDQQTYFTLAKAKIAEYAKKNQITKYKLYIVSDNIQDDFGRNGKPNYPDKYTLDLAQGYQTTSNPVNESSYTKIKFPASSLFTLSFSPNVDVSKYIVPGGKPDTSQPEFSSLNLTSFANGKKDNPKPANSKDFTISWSCNCPTGTTFNVQLSEINGGKYKDHKTKLTANSIMFTDVPSGTFKIVVSSPNANSAITYVETPESSFSWVVFILILLTGIGLGYYFWNKKRQEKIDVFASNKPDDIFSRGNNSSSAGNSSINSEYF